MNTKVARHPLQIVAACLSIFSIVAGIASATEFQSMISLANSEASLRAEIWVIVISSVLSLVFALAAPILLIPNKRPLVIATLSALTFLGIPMNLVLQLVFGHSVDWRYVFSGYDWSGGPWWYPLANIAQYTSIIALVLYLVAPKSAAQTASSAEGPRFDPMTGQPIVQAQPAYNPNATSFPTLVMVFAFFWPLAAVILGHVTLKSMDQGKIDQSNRSTAKTGLILGYVFIGLGFLVAVIWLIGVIALASRLSY